MSKIHLIGFSSLFYFVAMHCCIAQVQAPAVLFPKVQATIDSLYFLQGKSQQTIAVQLTDSARQRQQVAYQALLQKDQIVLEEISKQIGFPGILKVGAQSSRYYTFMVINCTAKPKFQERILKQMKPLLGKEADATAYAVLTDQVELAAGRAQLYGTQLAYNGDETGRQVQKPLADPAKVDKRRNAIGLTSLAEYLATRNKGQKPSNKPPKTSK